VSSVKQVETTGEKRDEISPVPTSAVVIGTSAQNGDVAIERGAVHFEALLNLAETLQTGLDKQRWRASMLGWALVGSLLIVFGAVAAASSYLTFVLRSSGLWFFLALGFLYGQLMLRLFREYRHTRERISVDEKVFSDAADTLRANSYLIGRKQSAMWRATTKLRIHRLDIGIPPDPKTFPRGVRPLHILRDEDPPRR